MRSIAHTTLAPVMTGLGGGAYTTSLDRKSPWGNDHPGRLHASLASTAHEASSARLPE
jgi:hypothetical protein